MAVYFRYGNGVAYIAFALICLRTSLIAREIASDTVEDSSRISPAVVNESDLSAANGDTISSLSMLHGNDTVKVASLNPLTVTANRRQRLVESARSLSIIRPDEWVGTTKSIADVIAEQTGVQTRRYGGTGSFQTVSIRGVQGSEVLVLLDGIPLNSAMGGAVDLGAINPERLDEIEVYKGIVPAEFNGSALGGVINLKSASSAGKTASLDAKTVWGAYGYRKYGMEADHSFSESFRIFGSMCYTASDNNWPYLDRNKTPYNTADDQIKTVENHRYRFFEARLHPSFHLQNERFLASGISYSTSETGIPAEEGSTNRTARHSRELLTFTSRLNDEKAARSSAPLVITPEAGYCRFLDNTFWTGLDQSMGTSHGSIASSLNTTGELRSVLHIAHLRCIADFFLSDNFGGQAVLTGKHSVIGTTSRVSGFPHGDWPGNTQEISLAGDINYSLPAGRLLLGMTCGGAAKGIRSATEGGRNEALEMTVAPSDTVEYTWSAHGGIQCSMAKSLILFVNAARYSSVPSLREKYGAKGAVIPNPDLREETGITVEGGGRILCDRIFAEAILFSTKTRNGIVMLSDGYMIKPVNLASSLTSGVEATLWLQPVEPLRIELRSTLQNAENRSRLNNYYGKNLPSEPELSAIVRLTIVPIKGVEVCYWLDYKSPFFRDFGNTQRIPEDKGSMGLFFHNGQVKWKVSRHWEAGASIRNVNSLSLRYEEMAGSAEAGYSWILYPKNEWCVSAGYWF